MSEKNAPLLEAVNHLRRAEQEVHNMRILVATLLDNAAKYQSISDLARITDINRTTIYWLINTWSTNGHENTNSNIGS